MPRTTVVFYRDSNGEVPVLQWLDALHHSDKKGWAKCLARLNRLAEAGYELRRPEADILQDGIYELRAKQGHVQYRLLYFFHGRNVAVLAHSIFKDGAVVPKIDIERASIRKAKFEGDPKGHTHTEKE